MLGPLEVIVLMCIFGYFIVKNRWVQKVLSVVVDDACVFATLLPAIVCLNKSFSLIQVSCWLIVMIKFNLRITLNSWHHERFSNRKREFLFTNQRFLSISTRPKHATFLNKFGSSYDSSYFSLQVHWGSTSAKFTFFLQISIRWPSQPND